MSLRIIEGGADLQVLAVIDQSPALDDVFVVAVGRAEGIVPDSGKPEIWLFGNYTTPLS